MTCRGGSAQRRRGRSTSTYQGCPTSCWIPSTPSTFPRSYPCTCTAAGLPEEQRTDVDRVADTSLERTAVELPAADRCTVALVPVDAAIRRLALEGPVAHGPGPRGYLAANPTAVEPARA